MCRLGGSWQFWRTASRRGGRGEVPKLIELDGSNPPAEFVPYMSLSNHQRINTSCLLSVYKVDVKTSKPSLSIKSSSYLASDRPSMPAPEAFLRVEILYANPETLPLALVAIILMFRHSTGRESPAATCMSPSKIRKGSRYASATVTVAR